MNIRLVSVLCLQKVAIANLCVDLLCRSCALMFNFPHVRVNFLCPGVNSCVDCVQEFEYDKKKNIDSAVLLV